MLVQWNVYPYELICKRLLCLCVILCIYRYVINMYIYKHVCTMIESKG